MRIDAPWLRETGFLRVVDALGGRCWAVGGCVRNTLLGAPVSDVDLATPLRPDEVIRRIEGAGLRAVPTGIAHGTITAVADGAGYEITTFRADEETDGRHASVRFSESLEEDAARRDFTINALYAAADGEVRDPVGGIADIEARRVRFIGEAEDRIREDYLRILRFFRFHAWYGLDGLDADGLAACADLADGIDRLARERVGWEMRKLLAAPDPAPAVAAMQAAGVLRHCLPGADARFLAPLVHAEAAASVAPDWLARLAAAGGEDAEAALRLSRAEARVLEAIEAALGAPPAAGAYRHGARAARAAALIGAAIQGGRPPERLEAEIARGAAARMPLTAADLMAAGLPEGPAIGRALARAEADWVDHDFELDSDQLLADALREGQQT